AIKAMSGMIGQHARLGAPLVLALAASPFPYVALGCSALGMLIFQTGLQRCRVSIVGPVSNITGSVFFLVLGTWLFGERLPADPAKLALRLAGIVLAAVVVAALARRPSRAAPARVIPSTEPADGTAAPVVGAAGSPATADHMRPQRLMRIHR